MSTSSMYKFSDYFAKEICKQYFQHKCYVPKQKASGAKIGTFFGEKWRDEAVDHNMNL